MRGKACSATSHDVYNYDNYSTPDRGAEYCDERVCLSVRDHIFGTTCPIFTMYMLPMAVAWSSSGGVRAQQYVTYFQFSE